MQACELALSAPVLVSRPAALRMLQAAHQDLAGGLASFMASAAAAQHAGRVYRQLQGRVMLRTGLTIIRVRPHVAGSCVGRPTTDTATLWAGQLAPLCSPKVASSLRCPAPVYFVTTLQALVAPPPAQAVPHPDLSFWPPTHPPAHSRPWSRCSRCPTSSLRRPCLA